MKAEGSGLGLEDRHAENIRRQQVAGELQALELQAQGLRQTQRQGGLADTGNVLHQQMAACQEAGQGETDLSGFSEHDAADGIQCRFQFRVHQGLVSI